jgi:membrane protein YdbS with pleckstrin-like domain
VVRALITLRHGVSSTIGRIAQIVLGAVVGLGVPVLWIWIGSQVQNSTAPSWTALAVVHVGMITTLLAIAGVFSFFVARAGERKRARVDWMRGQSEERHQDTIAEVHPLEMIVIFAVFVDVIVFLVWFFFFADPGNPVGQG